MPKKLVKKAVKPRALLNTEALEQAVKSLEKKEEPKSPEPKPKEKLPDIPSQDQDWKKIGTMFRSQSKPTIEDAVDEKTKQEKQQPQEKQKEAKAKEPPRPPEPEPAPPAEPLSSKAGTTFRDCPDCPEMVVVAPGSFNMGSNLQYQNPVHRVVRWRRRKRADGVADGGIRGRAGRSPSGGCGRQDGRLNRTGRA